MLLLLLHRLPLQLSPRQNRLPHLSKNRRSSSPWHPPLPLQELLCRESAQARAVPVQVEQVRDLVEESVPEPAPELEAQWVQELAEDLVRIIRQLPLNFFFLRSQPRPR